MKKVILGLAMAFVATTASAAIKGTAHDLTPGNVAGGTAGACQYCHMPHNANPAITAAPIWSRTVNTNPAAYTLKTTGSGAVPNLLTTQYSLLCLSCHDGSTAMGMLWNGQKIGNQAAIASTNSNYIGTNLTTDHPVGVVYPLAGSTATSTGLVTRTAATTAGFAFFGAAGNIECGSCHDPHNNANGFFKRTVAGDFCIACHGTK